MFTLPIVLLALALAIDAAVVSFAMGLLAHEHGAKIKFYRGMILSFVFGFFQFLMLWVGSYGGFLFSFSSYGHLFQIIVGLIFIIIGIKFWHESMEEGEQELKWGFIHIFLLGGATSIDALAAGISFGTLPHAHLAAIEVGIITALTCGIFYACSMFFTRIPKKWLLRLAALITFGLGINSTYPHAVKLWNYL